MRTPELGEEFQISSGKVLRTTKVFDTYWQFAYERQQMFFKRLRGESLPWTSDPILSKYRFTNVYRASDRVSQYLIKHVIYEGDQTEEEIVFRTLLFKLFNKIETWELLSEQLGVPAWRSFDLSRYDAVIGKAVSAGAAIYSPAYIIPSPMLGSPKKHTDHLLLLAQVMKEGLPRRIVTARSLEHLYLTLRSIPSLGPFLAFQFAIDLNYSSLFDFSEMDFVVAGPGARSGIRKIFNGNRDLTDEDLIQEVANAADNEFKKRGLRFQNLWGRRLQLIDCQNLFCEVDKYSRAAFPNIESGRTRIKRKFAASPNPVPQWYPPKWRLEIPADIAAGT